MLYRWYDDSDLGTAYVPNQKFKKYIKYSFYLEIFLARRKLINININNHL